jgi:hypothetical protein
MLLAVFFCSLGIEHDWICDAHFVNVCLNWRETAVGAEELGVELSCMHEWHLQWHCRA